MSSVKDIELDNLVCIRSLQADIDWGEDDARRKLVDYYMHLKINGLQTQQIRRVMVGYRGDDIKYIYAPDEEIQLKAIEQFVLAIHRITKPHPEAILYVLKQDGYMNDSIIHHCSPFMTDKIWAFVVRKKPTYISRFDYPKKIIQQAFVESIAETIVYEREQTDHILQNGRWVSHMIDKHKHKIDPDLLKVLDFYML